MNLFCDITACCSLVFGMPSKGEGSLSAVLAVPTGAGWCKGYGLLSQFSTAFFHDAVCSFVNALTNSGPLESCEVLSWGITESRLSLFCSVGISLISLKHLFSSS